MLNQSPTSFALMPAVIPPPPAAAAAAAAGPIVALVGPCHVFFLSPSFLVSSCLWLSVSWRGKPRGSKLRDFSWGAPLGAPGDSLCQHKEGLRPERYTSEPTTSFQPF